MSAKLKHFREQRAKLVKEGNEALDAVQASCEKDGRGPTPEELQVQADWDKKIAAADSLIKLEEARIERGCATVIPVPNAGPVDDPDDEDEDDLPTVTDLDRIAPINRRKGKGRKISPRILGRKNAWGGSLGAQLQAIRNAARDPVRPDPRLFAAAAGASESIDSDGGFLVQQQWGGMLQQMLYDTGILVRECRRITLDADKNAIKFNIIDETSRVNGSRFGGIQVYWAAEADAATATKPKLRRLELAPKKLIGLMYATDELLEDASALEGFINEWFPSEFGFKLDDAIFQGTGAGQPLGILNSPALVSIAIETGQATKTVNATNLEKMYAAMVAFSLPNAKWYFNQNLWPQLFQLSHAIGTGGVPVFIPAGARGTTGDISGPPFGTLLGRPLQPIEQAATLGTVGDIVFADLSRYLCVDKGPIEQAASIHVKFLTDESVFRWTLRFDGQPIPAAALTPYKGTPLLSPFVALATR